MSKSQVILASLTILMMSTTIAEAIEGVYTKWDVWSPCDATCGTSLRRRYRACFPIGADCVSNSVETDQCNLSPCPGTGQWGRWTKWTECTKTCGIGMQTQSRSCLSHQKPCIGSNREVKICNTNPCKVSGGWSAWNAWSSCSEPCGRGVRYQDRTCEDPAPSAGGLSCRGIGTKIGFCFEKPCSDKAATQVSVFDGESYLEYEKTFVSKKLLSIYIKFKPEERDGLLVYRFHGANDSTTGRNDTVMLRLEGAVVEFYVHTAGIITSIRDNDSPLDIGKWHNVFAAIAGSRMMLRVNNAISIEKKFGNVEMEKVDLDQRMFIGGLSEIFASTSGISHPGFVGWISNVRASYEDYFLDETEEVTSVNEETNHPAVKHNIEKWDIHAEDLYPEFSGDDYSVFSCSDCHGRPDILIEVIIKPFNTSAGLLWSSLGEEAGSYVMLFFRKNSLTLCINLGMEKVCTTTEPITEHHWLSVSVSVKSKQAKLRLNHEHAYIITTDGEPYRAKPAVHFAGGELDYWTIVYLVTKQTRGFSGILYSLSINKKYFDVLREVAMKETGRLISAASSSIAAKYDEFHEPPMSEVEFQCDLSVHEEKLGVAGGVAFWIREGEIIQNFSSINIQKVVGMKHATRLTIQNREIGDQDGFYGCLLRTSHYEILVHVFGISFDDANEIDLVEVSETAVLVAALLGSFFVLGALIALLKSGLMRRFPPYNAIMQKMPSWFTEGHRKNFLLRHTCSLQRTGQLPADYIQRLMTMQEKAIQTPSAMDLSRLYGHPRDRFNYSSQAANIDSDYDQPIPRNKSDGTVFPRPLIARAKRASQPVKMKIPGHIRKSPDKYLPDRLIISETSDSETDYSRSTATGGLTSTSGKSTAESSSRTHNNTGSSAVARTPDASRSSSSGRARTPRPSARRNRSTVKRSKRKVNFSHRDRTRSSNIFEEPQKPRRKIARDVDHSSPTRRRSSHLQRRSFPAYPAQFPSHYGTPPATARRHSSLPGSPVLPGFSTLEPAARVGSFAGPEAYGHRPRPLPAYLPRPLQPPVMPQNQPYLYHDAQWTQEDDQVPYAYGPWDESQGGLIADQQEYHYAPPPEFVYGAAPQYY